MFTEATWFVILFMLCAMKFVNFCDLSVQNQTKAYWASVFEKIMRTLCSAYSIFTINIYFWTNCSDLD